MKVISLWSKQQKWVEIYLSEMLTPSKQVKKLLWIKATLKQNTEEEAIHLWALHNGVLSYTDDTLVLAAFWGNISHLEPSQGALHIQDAIVCGISKGHGISELHA